MKGIKRRVVPTLLIGLVCFPSLGGIVLAMSSDNYGIGWSVISGGGKSSGSDNYVARSTLGQTATGFSSSDNYGAGLGYWQREKAPPPPPVGGEAYPPNKLAVLAPWLAWFAAIIASATIFLRRRRVRS